VNRKRHYRVGVDLTAEDVASGVGDGCAVVGDGVATEVAVGVAVFPVVGVAVTRPWPVGVTRGTGVVGRGSGVTVGRGIGVGVLVVACVMAPATPIATPRRHTRITTTAAERRRPRRLLIPSRSAIDHTPKSAL